MKRFLSFIFLFFCTLALSAQSAKELIQEDVLRAGGVYYMYPFKAHRATPAPKGYTPVYLSHYGRHGARYLEDEIQYERVLGPLRAAHEAGALTEEGERLYGEVSAYCEQTQCLLRAGDLTPLGWDQHRKIAQEIYKDNEALFKKRPAITAGATQYPRCIVSMTAFCQSLLKMDPKLSIYAQASREELDALNPRAKQNPRRSVPPQTEGRYQRKDPWGTGLKEFTDRRIDHKAICARYFKDPAFTEQFRGTRAFVSDLYDWVFNLQCTPTDRSLLWAFKEEEIYPLWEINNYIHYMGAGTPATLRDRLVLQHLVADADSALAAGKPAVRLRFGHDTVVLALLSMMEADGFGIIPENADGISEHWWNFRSPMAATLYLAFCRSKAGDVLFKLVVNGDEASFPNLAPVSGPWYRWSEFKRQLKFLPKTYANRAEAIAAQIHDPRSEYVVVACHRGDWRNFPENSISAIESIIRCGADIMELDLKMTKDSVLVLSHDHDVLRCTNFRKVFKNEKGKSAKVKDLTYAEIRKLSLKRAHGVVIDTVRMPTLRQALACCKDRICVNVDQGYEYYDQVLAIAEELGVTDQILIKGKKPIAEVAAHEAKYAHNMMYMPIVDIQKEQGKALLKSYLDQGVVPLAYEVCWGSNDDGAFPAACKAILGQGSKVWVNTIWAELCGGSGNDDDAAFIARDPGSVYQQYLDAGVSMIQTDRPELLINWLVQVGRHSLK